MNNNTHICKVLEQMYERRIKQGDKYRARAYERVIPAIRKHPKIQKAKDAKDITGVGVNMLKHIDEIIKTGTISELSEELKNINKPNENKNETIELFKNIQWVGDKTAEKWYEMGYRKIEDIDLTNCNANQKICIELYEELSQKIPRNEIVKLENYLHCHFDKKGINFEICGAYRRGETYSDEISILVRSKLNVIDEIIKLPIFKYKFSKGIKKYMGICKIEEIHRKIEIEVVEPEEYCFALFHLTGPSLLVSKMRDRAKLLGMKLNDRALLNYEFNPIKAEKESDIFYILGINYIIPTERNIINDSNFMLY